jgi:hypothetical protein
MAEEATIATTFEITQSGENLMLNAQHGEIGIAFPIGPLPIDEEGKVLMATEARAILEELAPNWADHEPGNCQAFAGEIADRLLPDMPEPAEAPMVKRPKQGELGSIVSEVDGDDDLNDIQMVEKIIRLKVTQIATRDELQRTTKKLVDRLQARGVTEPIRIGDHMVTVGHKVLTEHDAGTLTSLKACVTDELAWKTLTQVPSGKQLKVLSDAAGAAAKAVIASSRRKMETDTPVLKIKKPQNKRSSRRNKRS